MRRIPAARADTIRAPRSEWRMGCLVCLSFLLNDLERRSQYAGFSLGEALFFLASSGVSLGEVLYFLALLCGVLFFPAGVAEPIPWKSALPRSHILAQVVIRRAWALAWPLGRCTALLLLLLRSFLLLRVFLITPPRCPTLFANCPCGTYTVRSYGLSDTGLPCH